MELRLKTLATAAASSFCLALASGVVPAHAQETQQQQQQPQQQQVPGAEVDDATLQAFAEASLEVEEVIAEWTPRIEEAGEGEQANELRATANQEIAEAVRSNGIEIETYNQIYQLAQADPQVANQIQRYRQGSQ
ncbi:DUF4168 domain-containing protein [Chelativorans sp. YIM 93263]|uniref:DUF4168 domain-containing protein n=1 Tax=Chelativorans sp. YIM 93263 TaxID=2906648 RepID=UPI0023797D66|nr:DUF4168 domain-containing protein [Chelativorans sp. YIM 93263]